MSVTQQDVIDYLEYHYPTNYKIYDNNLHIIGPVSFYKFKFNTLPSGMVFDYSCNLDSLFFNTIPEDIVLNICLNLDETQVDILPRVNINRHLYVRYTDIRITDYTYIGGFLFSTKSHYSHLHKIYINGYIFNTGVLS